MTDVAHLPRDLRRLLDERLTRLEQACRRAGVRFYDDAGVDEHLGRVLLASDFACEVFLRDPRLLGPDLVRLMNDPRHADARAGGLQPDSDDAAFRAELRRFRQREAVRLIWRDVNELDGVETTLSGSSVLAESCLQAALAQAEHGMARSHGVVRDDDGNVQRLVVLALGKLGGGELNFSSDVDLILTYPNGGHSDGARPLDAESWFARLGQALVSLLADRSADGYVYRVDLRLRPFGNAGRLALSFAAMEHYYQREGRDWERYAWIKARPVAGDRAAGMRLIETLRPFVFRRYLDYTAFAGLREMKALIDAEVARKDLAAHIKLGPGGIREIEFIVQLMQLIRGGREPALRVRGLLPALAACEHLGFIGAASARRLREAYRFLRRLENRLQMFNDAQTHDLPADAAARVRIAGALGGDWDTLMAQLERHRHAVGEEFASLMAPARHARRDQSGSPWPALWQRLQADEIDPAVLVEAGFDPPGEAVAAIEHLLASVAVRTMSARARERLDRVLPALLASAAASNAPAACLARLLRLVRAVARRSVYLALLDEQPAALKRLTDVCAASAFLAERISEHPLLLDELFDDRLDEVAPDRFVVEGAIARRLKTLEGADTERELEAVAEEKLAAQFRIGLALLAGRLDATAAARALAAVAEAVLAVVLGIAERDVAVSHGYMDARLDGGAGLIVVAYGSFGGAELGFSSDLDLVFLYDGDHAERESSGPRALDGHRYYARLAQRILHMLTLLTRSGRLYEVDVRLGPDGGKGLLVTTLAGYAEYQRARAWTWEHQALVRAHALAGDVGLSRNFAQLRRGLLLAAHDKGGLRNDIVQMRERWRTQRDRSDALRFDLKQGAGGLVDIEFLLQAQVLQNAGNHPNLLDSGNSADLIIALAMAGVLDVAASRALGTAHAWLLDRALACTLDARPRLVPRDAELAAHTTAVLEIARGLGLRFAAKEAASGERDTGSGAI